MSLPPTQRDISEHPSAGAVTDPVNKTQKDADVDRKLRFYGVIEAFRQGRLPDNTQIDETLKYVRDNSFLDVKDLSTGGQTLIQDVRDIIETARLIVAEKNADELFQNFIWHTQGTDVQNMKKDPNEVLPISKDQASSDGQEAVKHLRTILTLVLTNSEARKLLSDFGYIGRDLLATGAVASADILRPSKERMDNIDQSAPKDQFVTEGGRTAGPNETPVLEANVPGTQAKVRQHPHDELGSGTRVTHPNGVDTNASRLYGDARNDPVGFAQDNRNALGGSTQGGTRQQDPVDALSTQPQLFVPSPNATERGADSSFGGSYGVHEQSGPGAGTTTGTGATGFGTSFDTRQQAGAAGAVDDMKTSHRQDQSSGLNTTGNATEQTKQDAKATARAHADDVKARADAAPEGQKGEAAKQGFKEKAINFKDGLLGRVPQEHKDKASDHFERSKNFLSDEYFPQERRDQFIFRGKKVIVECQRHEDYQSSLRWLLDFIDTYIGHTRHIAMKGTESKDTISTDRSLNLALGELRTLLERFANGVSMDIVFDAINALVDDANRDEELRAWFKDVHTYVRKTLLEPGYVLEPDCNNQANALKDSGRQFYDGKYSAHFDRLFSSVGDFFRSMGEDPLNKRFGQDWARLTRDLLFDSDGGLKFKPELWGDVRKVILPELIDRVGYIPIPRVEYTDESLDLVLENLTLSGRNLFPNVVSIEAHNFIKFSPYNAITDEHHHDFTLHLGHIQADMRDVAFYFHKKTGIAKIRDSGLADVVLGGEGLSVTIHLSSTTNDPSSVFSVKSVNVKVDSLKFSIRDSKHDTLYNTLRPLALGLVKKQIQKAFRDAVVTGLEYVDGQLVGVRERMREAKDSDEGSRAKVLQELFHRKKDETASTKSTMDQHFKVVAKRDSVLLPGHGNPAGWVNRQSERAEAAKEGLDWRSQAFSIVGAGAGTQAQGSGVGSGAHTQTQGRSGTGRV